MKLNIGCGYDRKKGYVNIDQYKTEAVDKIADINKGLPFKDNSVERVYMAWVLEQVNNVNEMMREVWRVCKHNAEVEIIVPHFTNKLASQPVNNSFFNCESFAYFEPGWTKKGKHRDADFGYYYNVVSVYLRFYRGYNLLNYLEPLINKFLKIYENTFLRSVIPANEIRFLLKVNKTKKK